MILSARYVRRPRRVWYCDLCERPLLEGLIYLYGRAHDCDPMSALRAHVRCIEGATDPKIADALEQARTAQAEQGLEAHSERGTP